MTDPSGSTAPAKVSTRRRAPAIPSAAMRARPKPAKLLAVFVVDTDDKELTTPVK